MGNESVRERGRGSDRAKIPTEDTADKFTGLHTAAFYQPRQRDLRFGMWAEGNVSHK